MQTRTVTTFKWRFNKYRFVNLVLAVRWATERACWSSDQFRLEALWKVSIILSYTNFVRTLLVSACDIASGTWRKCGICDARTAFASEIARTLRHKMVSRKLSWPDIWKCVNKYSFFKRFFRIFDFVYYTELSSIFTTTQKPEVSKQSLWPHNEMRRSWKPLAIIRLDSSARKRWHKARRNTTTFMNEMRNPILKRAWRKSIERIWIVFFLVLLPWEFRRSREFGMFEQQNIDLS